MIKIYNRYIGNTGSYYRVEPPRNLPGGNNMRNVYNRLNERDSRGGYEEHGRRGERDGHEEQDRRGERNGHDDHDRRGERNGHDAPNLTGYPGGTHSIREKPPALFGGGFSDLFSSFLPNDIDLGDIILLLVLFLLYMDSRDEEFLIILIVVGISLFKGDG